MKWLKQYQNGWQMKYLAIALFEMDLDKFFDMFSLDNKEALFFSTKQFKLRSGEGFEMADKSDLTIMVEQIKGIKPRFIGYFCS